MQLRTRNFYGLIVFAHTLILLFAWALYRMSAESAPAARGAAFAQARGCVECHAGLEQTPAGGDHNECSREPFDANCADISAYFETVRLRRTFDVRAQFGTNNALIAGEQLVRKYYCFQCHGDMGQGGFANPGSLKGYVPGYFGTDFKILTRNANPVSVRSWIVNGIDPEILETPVLGRIAEFYLSRQAVRMPSYRSLDDEEIEVLVDYVIALNEFGPMTANAVRLYAEQSQSPDD